MGLVLFHTGSRTYMPKLEVSICFAKAPRKEIPEPLRNSFKILVVNSSVSQPL